VTDPNPPGDMKRAFTAAELARIQHAIAHAETLADLFTAVITGVYDTLLAGIGLSLAEQPEPLAPGRFAIPANQWQDIVAAAVDRSQAFGGAALLAVELADRMPDSYPDPHAPVPARPRVDHRPAALTLRVDRAAVDVIANCTQRLDALADRYGTTSRLYLDAAASWQRCGNAVLSFGGGREVDITRDGDLSLLVSTPTLLYAILFHPLARRCIVPGCGAVIADDATATADTDTVGGVERHAHVPNYPLDGPIPGTWWPHS